MSPLDFHKTILVPGLRFLTAATGQKPDGINWEDDEKARVLLLAIAGQETGWRNIEQENGGPGRGPWQLERETCYEVLHNPVSAIRLRKAVITHWPNPTDLDLYRALLGEPTLSVVIARLDLFCNSHPLPVISDQNNAWTYYLSTWRPGQPRPGHWADNYHAALAADHNFILNQGV